MSTANQCPAVQSGPYSARFVGTPLPSALSLFARVCFSAGSLQQCVPRSWRFPLTWRLYSTCYYCHGHPVHGTLVSRSLTLTYQLSRLYLRFASRDLTARRFVQIQRCHRTVLQTADLASSRPVPRGASLTVFLPLSPVPLRSISDTSGLTRTLLRTLPTAWRCPLELRNLHTCVCCPLRHPHASPPHQPVVSRQPYLQQPTHWLFLELHHGAWNVLGTCAARSDYVKWSHRARHHGSINRDH